MIGNEDRSNSRANPLPFAAMPHAAYADRRLKPGDRDLLAALTRHARNRPYCWPSNRRLAGDLGVVPRTVQYRLRHLERTGWITTEQTPKRRVIRLTWMGEVGVPKLAELLAQDFDDRKSWSGLHKAVERAWRGEIDPEDLADAYRQAMGPTARNRGAVFMTALKQSGRRSRRA